MNNIPVIDIRYVTTYFDVIPRNNVVIYLGNVLIVNYYFITF